MFGYWRLAHGVHWSVVSRPVPVPSPGMPLTAANVFPGQEECHGY